MQVAKVAGRACYNMAIHQRNKGDWIRQSNGRKNLTKIIDNKLGLRYVNILKTGK